MINLVRNIGPDVPLAELCGTAQEINEEIYRRKEKARRERASLPIEEKVRILVEMQKRANEVRRAVGRPEMIVWELK